MTHELDILIPVYFRSHQIKRVYTNAKQCTRIPHRITFIIERADLRSRSEVAGLDANVIVGNFGSYNNAMNTAYFQTCSPFFFVGVDDLEFTPDWDVPVFKILDTRPEVAAVTSNSDGTLSSYFTIRRDHPAAQNLVSGMPPMLFYPYYHHESDRELYWTLKNRGALVECPESLIHHRHEWDETQKKTVSMDKEDFETYWNRRHLFRGA